MMLRRAAAFFLAVCVAISVSGCGASKKKWAVSKITYADGSYDTFSYAEDGKSLEMKKYDSESKEQSRTVYEFNDAGKEEKVTTYIGDKVNGREEFTYTKDGYISLYVLYNASGYTERKIRYETDKKGNITLERTISENASEYRKWEYDSDSHVIKSGVCDDKGEYLSYVVQSDYDSDNLSAQHLVRADGGRDDNCYDVSYDYDSNENLIKETIVQRYNDTDYTMVNEYTYDDHNNRISAKSIIEGEVSDSLTYRYTYDENGNVTTQEDLDSSGNAIDSKKYEYTEVKYDWYTNPNNFTENN